MAASSAEASFLRDVVRPNLAMGSNNRVQEALLAKAVPLEEYRASLRSRGMDFGTKSRELQNNNGMDDYYMDESFMNNFTGYSLKYAACQPVQRFSEDAVLAGEYNPLVTDDIVILRLCPSGSCNPKRAYGCSSKYIDYAISIGDYVRIMLRYKMDKKQNLCNWCSSCLAQRRRLEDQVVEDEAENDDKNQDDQLDQEVNEDQDQAEVEQEDEAAGAGDDAIAGDDAAGAAGDDNAATGDDGASNAQYSSACPYFEKYCYANGVSVCEDETADGDDGSSSYMAIEGYFNLLNCQNVNGYYLRPRCNGYDQSISMGIFYDKFCSQYAGDKVNVNSLFGGLGIEPTIFQEFSSGKSCVDCSESVRISSLVCHIHVPGSSSFPFFVVVVVLGLTFRVLVHSMIPTPTCAIVCTLPLAHVRRICKMCSMILRTKTSFNVPTLKCFARAPTMKKVGFTRPGRSFVRSRVDKRSAWRHRCSCAQYWQCILVTCII